MFILTLLSNMRDATVKFGCHLAIDNGNPGPLPAYCPPPPPHTPQAITTNTITVLPYTWTEPGTIRKHHFVSSTLSPYLIVFKYSPCLLLPYPLSMLCWVYCGTCPTEPSCWDTYHGLGSRNSLQVLVKKEAPHSILDEANPFYQPQKLSEKVTNCLEFPDYY